MSSSVRMSGPDSRFMGIYLGLVGVSVVFTAAAFAAAVAHGQWALAFLAFPVGMNRLQKLLGMNHAQRVAFQFAIIAARAVIAVHAGEWLYLALAMVPAVVTAAQLLVMGPQMQRITARYRAQNAR